VHKKNKQETGAVRQRQTTKLYRPMTSAY
jgi:hypothetical protein